MKVKEYLKNLEDNDLTLYTTDGKHFMFKDEFLKEYPDDLEIKEIKEDSEGKIVYTNIERKFTNDCDFDVTLKQWDDGRWFIDMGCQLWNRVYQSENMALNFLAKNGWKEKDAKKVTVIYLGEEVEMEREVAELFVRYNKDASIK